MHMKIIRGIRLQLFQHHLDSTLEVDSTADFWIFCLKHPSVSLIFFQNFALGNTPKEKTKHPFEESKKFPPPKKNEEIQKYIFFKPESKNYV